MKTVERFQNNLEAMIHEGITKIGYQPGESISVYYTKDLMNHLLDIQSEDVVAFDKLRKDLIEELEPKLGCVSFSKEQNRYKIIVPSKGVSYVKEKFRDNTFLHDLIDVLSAHGNLEQVKQVFYKYSNKVICEKVNHDEFDYVIYFEDKNIDEFYYCFTFDQMGKYYHRFTKYDYENLIKECE